MIQLRDYQQSSIDMIREAIKQGHRSICLVMPTGAGKSRTSASICKTASQKGNHTLFLAPRRNLVDQIQTSYNDLGLDCGVIMSGEYYDARHMIDVGSIDTVLARINKYERSSAKTATKLTRTLICDEAHTYASSKRAEYINDVRDGKYGDNKIVILLTATPCTTNGGGLADICEVLLQPVSMLELIKQGHLLQPRYYSAPKPDLSGITVQKDEYNNKELGEAYADKKIMGCVVENWKRIAPGTSTVVFCASRANANDLVEKFNSEGIPAAYVDALTPDNERFEIFKKISTGEILIICNVMIIGMGTDIPRLQTVCFATATKSISRWMQGVGRVLRPFEDQKFANVIDHGGMSLDPKMGPVEFIDDWSLDSASKVQDRIEQRKQDKKEPKEIECEKCRMLFKSTNICPGCGHILEGKKAEIQYHKAQLKEVVNTLTPEQRRNRDTARDEKTRIFAEFRTYCRDKKKKEGAAAYMYKEMFGVWPNAIDKTYAESLSVDVKKWIQHRNIKYSKQVERGKRHLNNIKAMFGSTK